MRSVVHDTRKEIELVSNGSNAEILPQYHDRECHSLKWSMNNSLRRWRRAVERGAPEAICDALSEKYNVHRKQYRKTCKEKKEEANLTAAKALHIVQNSQDFWKCIKTLTPHTNTSNSISKQAWFEHFETVYTADSGHGAEEEFEIESDYTNDAILDAEFNALDIKVHLKALKNKKAPGTDLIPNEIRKLATTKVLL